MNEETTKAVAEMGDALRHFMRSRRWGTCGDCPRDGNGEVFPELCPHTGRYDHNLSLASLADAFRTAGGAPELVERLCKGDGILAYRCVVAALQEGKVTGWKSHYTGSVRPVSAVLHDPAGFHVGTSRRFCTDHYGMLVDESDEQATALLTLAVAREDLQDPSHWERWVWPCATEVVVTRALVLGCEILRP